MELVVNYQPNAVGLLKRLTEATKDSDPKNGFNFEYGWRTCLHIYRRGSLIFIGMGALMPDGILKEGSALKDIKQYVPCQRASHLIAELNTPDLNAITQEMNRLADIEIAHLELFEQDGQYNDLTQYVDILVGYGVKKLATNPVQLVRGEYKFISSS